MANDHEVALDAISGSDLRHHCFRSEQQYKLAGKPEAYPYPSLEAVEGMSEPRNSKISSHWSLNSRLVGPN